MTARDSRITVQLPSGLKLEASLARPPQSSSENKLAVCLHPWSWLGGRMNDPVLAAIKQPLLSKGYYVLRYNSRGVGESSGWPSLTGIQEGNDLQEVVRWALQEIQSITNIVILGYSHGSLVASLFSHLDDHPSIQVQHILLAYPLGPRSWLTAFRGKHYTSALATLLRDPRSNVLVIYGDQDDFTGIASYETWSKSLQDQVVGENRGKLEVVRVQGANHFWSDPGCLNQMLQAIHGWVS